MSDDISLPHKGGRAGSKFKRRWKDESSTSSSSSSSSRHKQVGGGSEGAIGRAAWATDSIKAFAEDAALLAANRAVEETRQEQLRSQPSMNDGTGGVSEAAAAASAAASSISPLAALPVTTSDSSPSSPSSSTATASSCNRLSSLLTVDGSLLEGGGQVLRSAIVYSSLLNIRVSIHSIRAGRPAGGGLKAQHCTGLDLVARMVADGAHVTGNEVGSRRVEFMPGSRPSTTGGKQNTLSFHADTRTAGAIGLLIQVSLPVALFLGVPTELRLKGGTNATMAPLIDYTSEVLLPIMERAGWIRHVRRTLNASNGSTPTSSSSSSSTLPSASISLDCITRGFFPKGGGEVLLQCHPASGCLPPLSLVKRGRATKVIGTVLLTHRLPTHIGERIIASATRELKSLPELRGIPLELSTRTLDGHEAPTGDGVSFLLVAHTDTGCVLASSCVGERGLPAEEVGRRAGSELVANLEAGGSIDEYAQDQLILFMVFAKGTSTMKTGPLTMHTRTCLYWAQWFTRCVIRVCQAKSEEARSWGVPVEETDSDETFVIQIEGIGYKSRF